MVECLKKQTLQDFEAVFVNDGSTDNSKAKLDEAVNSDLRFRCRVVNQENAGVSAARNAGLRTAEGRYVCFVDVDDAIAPDYFEVLHAALTSTGLRVAAAHITRDKQELYRREAGEIRAVDSGDFLREFLYRGIKYHVCACMFDKQCFAEQGVMFPEGFRYSEDVFVLWQIFAGEKAIAETQRKIYYYCNNPESAMNTGINLRRMDAIVLMKKLEPIIAEKNAGFSEEFNRYAVARHHWSILWQAATMLDSYGEFKNYCAHFQMRAELKKLLRYPELRISVSSLGYLVSPFLYYKLLRMLIGMKKPKK